MIIRAIDNNNDWKFGQGIESYNFGQAALGENIKTRIQEFINNCWFNMNAGIDWFTYFGIPGQKQATLLSVQAIVKQSYGVVKVNRIDLSVNPITRAAIIQLNIDTMYSTNYSQNVEVVNYA